MLFWILFVLLIVVIGVAAVRRGPVAAPPLLPGPAPDLDEEAESPTELSLRDPGEALRRYGTPADAARLTGEGADLSALGYRPPGQE